MAGGSPDPEGFIKTFLSRFLENRLLNGLITTDEYHDQLAELRKNRALNGISRRLFERAPEPFDIAAFGRMRVVYLREPNGGKFPFLQGLAQSGSPGKGNLTCFVGHRFLKNIESSLRFNLIHLFEPYGIALRWSGYDLSAKGVFEDILTGIKDADLCFFDNLGTLNKPNVYIEIGIAHALGKSMLVSEYVGSRQRVLDSGSVPSDLQGLFRIQYRNYQDLCQQLYFGLSVFLKQHFR